MPLFGYMMYICFLSCCDSILAIETWFGRSSNFAQFDVLETHMNVKASRRLSSHYFLTLTFISRVSSPSSPVDL